MGIGRRGHITDLSQNLLLVFLGLVGHVAVPLKQVLYALSAEEELVFGLVLVLTWRGDLVTVVVVFQDALGDEGGLDLFFHQLNPGEVLQPWMLLYLYDATLCTQPVDWFALNHLHITINHTLLIKSAASKDQLGGTSSALICTCLARIWSLISFLFLPL